MKTSNIILLSIVGSITFLILTGSMQLRFSGKNYSVEIEYESKNIELPDFHHLVVENVRPNFSISAGGKSGIEIKIDKASEMPTFSYRVEDDTLYIEDLNFNTDFKSFTFTLRLPENELVNIRSHNSTIYVNDYKAKKLTLVADKSRIDLELPVLVEKLQIIGRNQAHVRVFGNDLDTLAIDLHHSEVQVDATINKLQGSALENSKVNVKEANDLQLKKDKSSELNHWD